MIFHILACSMSWSAPNLQLDVSHHKTRGCVLGLLLPMAYTKYYVLTQWVNEDLIPVWWFWLQGSVFDHFVQQTSTESRSEGLIGLGDWVSKFLTSCWKCSEALSNTLSIKELSDLHKFNCTMRVLYILPSSWTLRVTGTTKIFYLLLETWSSSHQNLIQAFFGCV